MAAVGSPEQPTNRSTNRKSGIVAMGRITVHLGKRGRKKEKGTDPCVREAIMG